MVLQRHDWDRVLWAVAGCLAHRCGRRVAHCLTCRGKEAHEHVGWLCSLLEEVGGWPDDVAALRRSRALLAFLPLCLLDLLDVALLERFVVLDGLVDAGDLLDHVLDSVGTLDLECLALLVGDHHADDALPVQRVPAREHVELVGEDRGVADRACLCGVNRGVLLASALL